MSTTESSPISPSTTIDAYILYVHPVYVPDSQSDNPEFQKLCWDIFYVTRESSTQHCIRIYNVELSFLLARLPGFTDSQFKQWAEGFVNKYISDNKLTKSYLRISYSNTLVDASYFSPFPNRTYAVFTSYSPDVLNKFYKSLYSSCESLYQRAETLRIIGKLSKEDTLFYNNTETPFRYTSSTLNIKNTIYNLSCQHNIPLIGGVRIDTKYFRNRFPDDCLPTNVSRDNIRGISFSDLTTHSVIIKDESIGITENMTLLAYDIETYNPTGDLDPTVPEQPIICIGMGLFNLVDQSPRERYCIIWKDICQDPTSISLLSERLVHKCLWHNRPCYKVFGEYTDVQQDSLTSLLKPIPSTMDISKHPDLASPLPNHTNYIICSSEKDLLRAYIEIITLFRPQIITGFNTFGFDDNYVYERMRLHNLEQSFLSSFSVYDLSEICSDDSPSARVPQWYKQFLPVFKQFDLKIDGEARHDNKTVRATAIQNVDVYKLMLKEDPKRFTQYGRGNLDTMLEVYRVTNPFNNSPLKKTGMKIRDMFNYWETSDNIYSIALYCAQDAWITGTLLIKRNKLTDLIEMAGISNTSFSDSLYRADGIRVANAILGYAYNEHFALMDTAFEHRIRSTKAADKKSGEITIQKQEHTILGRKTYDTRTIVGGAVKNIHAGRQKMICALDYSAMYPSGKEGSNIDSASKIDDDIIRDPASYGLEVVKKLDINDIYGNREIYYVKRVQK